MYNKNLAQILKKTFEPENFKNNNALTIHDTYLLFSSSLDLTHFNKISKPFRKKSETRSKYFFQTLCITEKLEKANVSIVDIQEKRIINYIYLKCAIAKNNQT